MHYAKIAFIQFSLTTTTNESGEFMDKYPHTNANIKADIPKLCSF